MHCEIGDTQGPLGYVSALGATRLVHWLILVAPSCLRSHNAQYIMLKSLIISHWSGLWGHLSVVSILSYHIGLGYEDILVWSIYYHITWSGLWAHSSVVYILYHIGLGYEDTLVWSIYYHITLVWVMRTLYCGLYTIISHWSGLWEHSTVVYILSYHIGLGYEDTLVWFIYYHITLV